MSGTGNGHRPGDARPRELRDRDAVTEVDPETQTSDIAEDTEDQANQPGRLAGTLLMFRDIWRILRGEDQRGRKVRWMLGLLRPYRKQVIFMLIALVAATAAGLAPPYLAGAAIDQGIVDERHGRADDDRPGLPRVGARLLGRRATRRRTWWAGWASARSRTSAPGSTPTSRRCRSASSRGASLAC